MDIIDNIIYANLAVPLTTGPIQSDYLPMFGLGVTGPPATTNPAAPAPVYNFSIVDKINFCAYEDPAVIERSVLRHWYDVDAQAIYLGPGGALYSMFGASSTYHLIGAYLAENTRVLQIFERVIDKYLSDEELNIAVANTGASRVVFNWLMNSERLFFKNDSPRLTNIRSILRPNADASRRNAYRRLLGIDLAFGNPDSNEPVQYPKAKAANLQFIPLFEKYLAEIWQGYQNARNIAGVNSTDVQCLTETATQLRELLSARRGGQIGPNNTYSSMNLSREEFSAVLLTQWFVFVLTYNSPVVTFLQCDSSTIGERLMKIGNKVGIPAHNKSQALFEMMGPASSILCALEIGGALENAAWVQAMLVSLNPGTPASIQATFMEYFLTAINNWEKATGHIIKNRETTVSGKLSRTPVLAN
jgi:hypothetical protein